MTDLYVTWEEPTKSFPSRRVLALEPLWNKITEDEIESHVTFLANAILDSNEVGIIPRVTAQKLCSDFALLAPLAIKIDDEIAHLDIDQIVIDQKLDGQFQCIIVDVASANDIQCVNYDYPLNKYQKLVGYLSILIHSFILIIDQIVSMVSRWREDRDWDVQTILLPYSGREDSIMAISHHFTEEYIVVTQRMALSLFWQSYNSDSSQNANQLKMCSINSYATGHAILKEIQFLFQVLPFSLDGDMTIKTTVSKKLMNDRNILLDDSVSYHVTKTLTQPRIIRSILCKYLSDELFNKYNPRRVILDRSTIHRGIIESALESNITPVCIPHTLLVSIRQIPGPPEAPHIVAGNLETQQWSKYFEKEQFFLPLGRPYFDQFDNMSRCAIQDEPVKILIGTQPYDDEIRLNFVNIIQEALLESNLNFSLSIKIHPSESMEFYTSNFDDSVIEVYDSNLHKHLENADVVITINSNIGFEAIVNGTPCICLNKWHPDIPNPFFATLDPIPVLHSTKEFENYIHKLSKSHIFDLCKSQQTSIKNHYNFDNTPKEIARCIEQTFI